MWMCLGVVFFSLLDFSFFLGGGALSFVPAHNHSLLKVPNF